MQIAGSALIGRTGRRAGPGPYCPPRMFRPGCPPAPAAWRLQRRRHHLVVAAQVSNGERDRESGCARSRSETTVLRFDAGIAIALGVGSDAAPGESPIRNSSPWRPRRWNWSSGLSGPRGPSRRGWGPNVIDIDLDSHLSVEDRHHESDRFAVHGEDLTLPHGEWSRQDECAVAWLCCGPHGLILPESRQHGWITRSTSLSLVEHEIRPVRRLGARVGASWRWEPSRPTALIDRVTRPITTGTPCPRSPDIRVIHPLGNLRGRSPRRRRELGRPSSAR